MSIAVGQTAPDFTLMNQEKKEVKLSDFAGKKNVVLVWYPLDWSPTCTNEHMCFVNDMRSFETLDAEVLGVSVDSVWSHKAYAEKMGIKYSLLADFHPRGAMSEKYGIYLADKGITALKEQAGTVWLTMGPRLSASAWTVLVVGTAVLMSRLTNETVLPTHAVDKYFVMMNGVTGAAIFLSIFAIVAGLRIWRRSEIRVISKVKFSLVAAACLFLTWFSVHWHVIGPAHRF